MAAPESINIDDLRARARARLPRVVFDYLDGGAEDEATLRANRAAFGRYAFVPRVLAGHRSVRLSTTLLGDAVAVPWVVGPTGLNGIFRRDADLALARAAAHEGAVYAHAMAANVTLEAAAAAAGPLRWFQFYPWGPPEAWARVIARASGAGYRALVLTVDSLVPGNRERDRRHGFSHRLRIAPRTVLDGLAHPRWLADVWLRGGTPRMENLAPLLRSGASGAELADYARRERHPEFSWEHVVRVRDLWRGPMLVKGILHPDDASRAAAIGADGVVVSNHGGRQLDGAIATLDALPDIVRAAGRDTTILVDGGFRRGGDIVKALALGANAVILGRAPLYGVAADGERGVRRALEILREETLRVLALLGCGGVDEIGPDRLRRVDRAADDGPA
ncbi:MAG: alpha-hydroxy acid oxidase [Burkholderiales bacterium]